MEDLLICHKSTWFQYLRFLPFSASWNCLTHVNLIPPYDRILLQTSFAKLSRWAIDVLRDLILETETTLDVQRSSVTHSAATPTESEDERSMNLGSLPQARFILAMLGILTAEQPASGISLLLNSGLLALLQTLLRLAGKWLLFSHIYVYL